MMPGESAFPSANPWHGRFGDRPSLRLRASFSIKLLLSPHIGKWTAMSTCPIKPTRFSFSRRVVVGRSLGSATAKYYRSSQPY